MFHMGSNHQPENDVHFCSPELFFGLHPSLSSFGLVGYHSTNVIREGYDLGILNNQKIRSPTRWAPSRSLE